MRSVVLEPTNYFECRASVFRDLLFLCIYLKGITFAELVSDIKTLILQGESEMASMCLRQIYRFILNSVHVGDQDHFQTYLLALPEGMSRDDVKKFLIKDESNAEKSLEIVETLWEILTVYSKHNKILRSEALRAYTALYGEKLPEPYVKRAFFSQVPIDLTAERSSGSVVQIDMTRNAQALQAKAAAAAAKAAAIHATQSTPFFPVIFSSNDSLGNDNNNNNNNDNDNH